MEKNRFEVVKGSKFEKLSDSDMKSVVGAGICFSCMKRRKKWRLVLNAVEEVEEEGEE